jgi:predicted Zn-dependent peptidase
VSFQEPTDTVEHLIVERAPGLRRREQALSLGPKEASWSGACHASSTPNPRSEIPELSEEVAVEEPGAEVVRVNIRIDVGADADPPGKAGLAHLVEHLLFQGRDGDGATWAAALDQVALRYRGETAIHSTEYVAAVRRDRLAALLAVEARRLAAGCRAVSPETFARELEVVRGESRLRAERSADNRRDRILAAIAPADHPWARTTEGTASSLASMTREDVCAFFAAHYDPSRIVVVLSGDVRAREAVAEARRAFQKLSGGMWSPPPRPVPLRPHRVVLRDGEIMAVSAPWSSSGRCRPPLTARAPRSIWRRPVWMAS